jgi:hypothetical protein
MPRFVCQQGDMKPVVSMMALAKIAPASHALLREDSRPAAQTIFQPPVRRLHDAKHLTISRGHYGGER